MQSPLLGTWKGTIFNRRHILCSVLAGAGGMGGKERTLLPLKILPWRMMTILFFTDTPKSFSFPKSSSVPKLAYTTSPFTLPLGEKPRRIGIFSPFTSSFRRAFRKVRTWYDACVKADLDGTIFAYDYRARLAYVMTFDHPHAHSFHLQIYPRRPDVVGLTYTTRSDVKSWRMLVARHNRKQKSYLLNRPLGWLDI